MKRFTEWLEEKHPEMLEEGWRDWAKAAALAGTLAVGGMNAHAAEPQSPPAATRTIGSEDKELLDAYANYQKMLKFGNKHIALQNAAETKLDHLVLTKFRFLMDKNGNSDQTHRNIEEYLRKGGEIRQNHAPQQVRKTAPATKTIQTRSESPDLPSE